MRCGGADRAANHAVGFALVDHNGADQRRTTAHFQLRVLRRHALARHQLVVRLPIVAEALVVLGVHHGKVHALTQAQAEAFDAMGNHRRAADQDRAGELFIHNDLHGTQHALFFTFGINNTLRVGLGRREHRAHGQARVVHEVAQLGAIGVQVLDRTRGHAGLFRSLGNRRRDLLDQA